MDQALINQLNRAVDKGDTLAKQELLAQVSPSSNLFRQQVKAGLRWSLCLDSFITMLMRLG